AKAKGAFENTNKAALAQMQVALTGMVFFIFVLIRSFADADDGWSFPGPIHGGAVADRSTPLARVTYFWLSVTLVSFSVILAQLFLVFLAGKTFYNFIAA